MTTPDTQGTPPSQGSVPQFNPFNLDDWLNIAYQATFPGAAPPGGVEAGQVRVTQGGEARPGFPATPIPRTEVPAAGLTGGWGNPELWRVARIRGLQAVGLAAGLGLTAVLVDRVMDFTDWFFNRGGNDQLVWGLGEGLYETGGASGSGVDATLRIAFGVFSGQPRVYYTADTVATAAIFLGALYGINRITDGGVVRAASWGLGAGVAVGRGVLHAIESAGHHHSRGGRKKKKKR
jgi:hypothetical protein